MLMYAIIGAVVAGILMAVAHGKAKQGVAWAQPAEVAFGILAIIFGFWAVWENIMGVPETQIVAEKWQQVRGIGAAELIKQKCAGKKLLVIRNYTMEGHKDFQTEALLDGLKDMNPAVYELPRPKEVAGPDANPDMMFDQGGPMTPAMKKAAKKEAEEFGSALKAAHDPKDYDVVVFAASVYDFMIFAKPYNLGPIESFKDKQLFFLYSLDDVRMNINKKVVVGCVTDKALSNPDDYDKAPTGEQGVDFGARFEFKAPMGK